MSVSTEPFRVLYVTDLAYRAAGRRYGDEDVWLSDQLRRRGLTLALCHPLAAVDLMADFDVVMVRNSGPVLHHREAYRRFRERARDTGALVYNPLTGKGDMAGKAYLVELSRAGFPVIPTVEGAGDLGMLPPAEAYVVKPVDGADSIGMSIVPAIRLGEGVRAAEAGDVLVQPHIPFLYEVSFYFVDDDFQYALYAPEPEQRWRLAPYEPTADDLAFARRFVEWNGLGYGIQRVDACRAPGGELLLVELEDLNPFLSLDLVRSGVRGEFVDRLADSLKRLSRS